MKQSKKAYTVTLKKAVKGAYVVQAVREKKRISDRSGGEEWAEEIQIKW